MSIIKTTTPYEFLARWKNGALAGAHVKFLETITDDGAVVSQREGDPMSVAVAGAAGFPLDDILSALQTQAIAERDAAVAEKATAEAALSAATATHTTALAAKAAEIAALEAQVAALTPTPPSDPREIAKAARAVAVAAIKVTTQAGNTFDGDEDSQGRMARAIIALSTGLAPSVNWVLADNSVIQATAAELTEALVLSGMAQAALWVIE